MHTGGRVGTAAASPTHLSCFRLPVHQGVDYIGLNPSREHLLFYASSPETLRDLKVPLGIIRKYGMITINSDLVDAHLYVFDR